MIQFSVAQGFKTVPDSLVCLTPRQDIFLLQQVFDAKEYRASFVLNTQQIAEQGQIIYLQGQRIAEKDRKLDLAYLQTNNCLSDKEYLSSQLNKAERRFKILKSGFVIVGSLAILELGYIAVVR